MVDEYQFFEARAYGADVVLLIVAALSKSQLRDFYDVATELGMASLIEVHTADELERALEISPKKNIEHDIYQYITRNRLSPDQVRKKWNSKCIHLHKEVSIVDTSFKKEGIFSGNSIILGRKSSLIL